MSIAPAARADELSDAILADLPRLTALYQRLHANPELSFQESRTASRMARELRSLGFEVTTDVGGHGVVAVLRNGEGPTLAIRADMDGLPVRESTGLAYASTVEMRDENGEMTPVMHACGHDVHMTNLVGVATRLSAMRARWRGTLVLWVQPAEERLAGAEAMLRDGLYERFPRPDFAISMHVTPLAPAGIVAYRPGPAMAGVTAIDIRVRGREGHGATPELARDPVLTASQIVVALQSIVAREVAATDAGVITVGRIHGGTRRNIIAGEAVLELTVRALEENTMQLLVRRIREVAEHTARAAGVDEEHLPEVTIVEGPAPPVVNDPALVQRVVSVWRETYTTRQVVEIGPVMGSEDFAYYGHAEPKVPTFMFHLGVSNLDEYGRARSEGRTLPQLHTAAFRPEIEPTLLMGVDSMTRAALALLGSTNAH